MTDPRVLVSLLSQAVLESQGHFDLLSVTRRAHSLILKNLTSYLSRERQAAIFELAQRLGADKDAVRGMLAVLERKGLVRKLPAGTLCAGGCTQCGPETVEIYEWVGPPGRPEDDLPTG